MPTSELQISGGRTLQVTDEGDPNGVVVVVHHGTPGSSLLDPAWVDDARLRGMRLLSYARPGYGRSTRQFGRSVADAAADVAALADELGIEKLLTWGISGGGPHALACAALLPDRVVAGAALASIGPYGVDGLDFTAGMGEGNIAEFAAVLDGEQALRALLEPEARELVATTVTGLAEAMAPFLTPVDAAEIRGPLGEVLLAQFVDGCGRGVDGWVDDDLAFVRPWGFDPADIAVPVVVWQGEQDAMVPFAHGQWLAARIPAVEAHLTAGDGHLTLSTRRVPEVQAWLRQRWDDARTT